MSPTVTELDAAGDILEDTGNNWRQLTRMYKKNARVRQGSLHVDDDQQMGEFYTGDHMSPSGQSACRSNSICVGNLQINNERRLPAFPRRGVARELDFREMNRARLPTICSMEVFNEQAPRYDFYDPQPIQYSYVHYERTDRLTKLWRYARKKQHVLLPWIIGIAVTIIMVVLIVTQTVQDFKH